MKAILIEQEVTKGQILNHHAEVRNLPEDVLDGAAAPAADAAVPAMTVDVLFSGVNYKDGLAVGGRPGVLRTSPIIPGIDLVGRVRESADPWFSPGDLVVLTGGGIGESLNGGLAERARVSSEYLILVPGGITARQAAAIGTAGFTAMLSVLTLEREGVTPADGPVVVTGAAGGVGSIAVAVLAKLGYEVTALSGRADSQGDYLRKLGAANVIDRSDMDQPGPPLQKRRWGGGLDTVGSTVLANVLAQTRDGGAVTTCGLTAGSDLPATVMPFILRGVTVAGVSSVYTSRSIREIVWNRLATDLDLSLLDSMTTEIGLDDVPQRAAEILDGSVRGRTVVAIGR
ncbi:MDR family oxidoreductase [Ancrocorticia populi]|uniref:MDR family oxidoreductase n=1 Tax=Ancrocorticia populi TaxID=2175228 RepID=UPI003F8EACC2